MSMYELATVWAAAALESVGVKVEDIHCILLLESVFSNIASLVTASAKQLSAKVVLNDMPETGALEGLDIIGGEGFEKDWRGGRKRSHTLRRHLQGSHGQPVKLKEIPEVDSLFQELNSALAQDLVRTREREQPQPQQPAELTLYYEAAN